MLYERSSLLLPLPMPLFPALALSLSFSLSLHSLLFSIWHFLFTFFPSSTGKTPWYSGHASPQAYSDSSLLPSVLNQAVPTLIALPFSLHPDVLSVILFSFAVLHQID